MALHVTVRAAEFVRELALAMNAVERQSTIPILGNVKLESAAPGRLSIVTTDLELGMETSVPATLHTMGAVTIPARKLLGYVKLLPGDGEVSIKIGANEWSTISCGKAKCRIAGMSTASFPDLPVAADSLPRLTIKAADLARIIQHTMFAISAEESRFTLNGALLEVNGTTAKIVAADGHRLAVSVTQATSEGEMKFILPKRAMDHILRATEKAADGAEISLATDDNGLFCWIGSRLIYSRRMAGNFPDYTRILPKGLPNTVTCNRLELACALGRVIGFADKRSRAIRFAVAADSVTVSANTSDSGDSEESVTAEATQPCEIGFNAHYLLQYLGAHPEAERVEIKYKDASAAAALRAVGGDSDALCVVMPMRL